MHVDKYVVNNIGTKWTNGKDKKESVAWIAYKVIDGIELKKLLPLLEEWHETLNGGMGYKNVELIINVKEEIDE